MLNRHQIRERIVFGLYQHLLLKKDLGLCIADNFDDEEGIDNFGLKIVEDIKNNEESYIYEIAVLLNKWTFDRLNYIEQAILLLACSEIKQGLNDKPIVIDEAINIAKKYCDDDSHKFINGVLDKL